MVCNRTINWPFLHMPITFHHFWLRANRVPTSNIQNHHHSSHTRTPAAVTWGFQQCHVQHVGPNQKPNQHHFQQTTAETCTRGVDSTLTKQPSRQHHNRGARETTQLHYNTTPHITLSPKAQRPHQSSKMGPSQAGMDLAHTNSDSHPHRG